MPNPVGLRFGRFGKAYHVVIRHTADLLHAIDLDEAHWVATTAPLSSINTDPVFLDLLDVDHNGRITCDDIRHAARWLTDVLADPSGIDARSDTLYLDRLNVDNHEGARIRSAAEKILERLGHSERDRVTLDEVRQIKARQESLSVSEAGVVLPDAADDDDIARFIADAVKASGGAPHPTGAPGLTAPLLERFRSDIRDHLEWRRRGHLPPDVERTEILPLGQATPDAWTAFDAVRAKLDQYYAQCEAAALDRRLLERMGFDERRLATLDLEDPAVIEDTLRRAPLTHPRGDMALRFDAPINPAWVEAIDRFRATVVEPILGDTDGALTPRHWQTIRSTLEPYGAWRSSKAGANVEFLDTETLERYFDERFDRAVRELIEQSRQTAVVLDNVRLAEKVVLYQSLILPLANNFIGFPHLYKSDRRAMFEMGTLVMDGRRYTLAVRVDDRKEHARVAQSSNIYTIYVEVTPDDAAAKYEVAVPVTSGGRGNLTIGKRGVFYDLDGVELDARVVDLIENPISLREAMASPFKRLGRLITGKIESITAEAEKKLDSQASAAVDQVAPTPAGQPAPRANAGLATGSVLLGGGVAIAALGSAFAYITKTLATIAWWKIGIGVLLAVLAVIVPTILVAYIRLRGRDLSALLEGSSWGINARMRLTFSQGRFFTHRPRYPKGSKGVRVHWWRRIVIAAIILAILGGGGWLVRHVLQKRSETPREAETAEQVPPPPAQSPPETPSQP